MNQPAQPPAPPKKRRKTLLLVIGPVLGLTVIEGLVFLFAFAHTTHVFPWSATKTVAVTHVPVSIPQPKPSPPPAIDSRAETRTQVEQVFDWASRNSDQIDAAWNRGADVCVKAAPTVGDRAWFALWETAAVRLSNDSGYDCTAWLDNVETNAGKIRDAMKTANDAAREAGIDADTMRGLRQKYHVDWAGWDR